MPGIVGLITQLPSALAQPQLASMLNSRRLKESCSMGTWADQSLGAYVGWSARRRSFCDGMPLLDKQRGVYLLFSGKEYSEARDIPTASSQEPQNNFRRCSFISSGEGWSSDASALTKPSGSCRVVSTSSVVNFHAWVVEKRRCILTAATSKLAESLWGS